MKLEFESNTTTFPSVENDLLQDAKVKKTSAEAAEMLNAGIKAAQEGRRAEARNLLLRVTEMDSENENAWLWLASISEYPEELLVFLNSVLKINPENVRALEWVKATKSLLSKTFVQRGIDASKELHKDFAKQCFLQAIVHDNQNEMAWLWLASAADSDEEKTSHLQKVLSINSENLTAQASLKSIKKQMAESSLQQAFAAALDGENARAADVLREVFKKMPEMEDAWILKSFLATSCAEKLACFEKVLELNPANNLARANADFLRAMSAKFESGEMFEQDSEMEDAEMEAAEEAFAEDKSPTEELEMPEHAVAESDSEEEPQAEFEEAEATAVSDEMTEAEESFAAQNEFSDEIQPPKMDEVSFADEAVDEIAVVPGAAESEFETENFDSKDFEMVEEAESFADVEELPQVYAFQEMEVSAQPELEAPELEASESIHETEPAGFYSDFAEETEYQTADVESSDVYEIEADEFSSPEAVEEFEAPELEAAEEEFSPADVFLEDDDLPKAEELVAADGAQNAEADVEQTQPGMFACPFCDSENEPQAFVCTACRAVLTLSDMEMLLAQQEAHKDILADRIEQIEKSKSRREFEVDELRLLAIGYLNLKNLHRGVSYLKEAARLNPDDIVLSSQVNALKIRLSEIEKQQSVHDSMPKNRQILVVDDSATVRRLISGKLEKCGHEVICAIDGVDALEKLKEISPDLILLDINMPRMDGYQVCKLIRGNEEMKDTPIVMISGKDGFFDKVRGRMAGTTGYITKPFGPETLMKTVETYIVQPA
ncbi:MAG TPA: response regulator [Pyrinomonadaceae bacterium]|jgi:CheY-like chemotaxis protein